MFCKFVRLMPENFFEKYQTNDWIMEQWEKNYYISSIAGAVNGSSLVVMSKDISHVGVCFLWNACLWRMWLTFVFVIYEE
ncbi:unnamed protein product [Camellia sinensis]